MNNAKTNRPKVLMIGPAREVKGGVSAVVNTYYDLGIDSRVAIKYIATMRDGSKLRKLLVAIWAYIQFAFVLPRYDIVHVHMAAQASFTRKSFFVKKAKKAGKKIIIHEHGGTFIDFFHQSSLAKKSRIKYIFDMADKVFVLSEEWKTFFGEKVCSQDKIEIIYNGVIIPSYSRSEYCDHNILYLGRIEKLKGIFDLLYAMPSILQTIPDAVLYVAGDGEMEECRRIIQNCNISKNVKLLGWVRGEDKEQILKACSTFILPSYYEAMPISLLEAMSYEMAVVASEVGGITRIIDDRINGLYIQPGNVNEITSAIVTLLSDISFKKNVAKEGRQKIIEKFNAMKNMNDLLMWYKNISDN